MLDGMRLPDLERAVVPPVKLRDYLLNDQHPVGRAKARFLFALGFRRERWHELAAALRMHAATGDTTVLAMDPFGQRYVVRGTIVGPGGAEAGLLAVWITQDLAVGPRFITAYPEESR